MGTDSENTIFALFGLKIPSNQGGNFFLSTNYGLKRQAWTQIVANNKVFSVIKVKDRCILRNTSKIGARQVHFRKMYLYRCNVQIIGTSGNPGRRSYKRRRNRSCRTKKGFLVVILKGIYIFCRMPCLQVVGLALEIQFLLTNHAGNFLELACAQPPHPLAFTQN